MLSKAGLLLLLPTALAGILPPGSLSTRTKEFCSTKYAKSSVRSLPTKTSTHVLPTEVFVVIQTTHPTVIKTPAAVTSTTTSTSTVVTTFTDSAITDTFSTTTTDTQTDVFTSTIVSTSTETDVSTFTTSTSTLVAEPPNFTNAFESSGDTTYVPPKHKQRRGAPKFIPAPFQGPGHPEGICGAKYPSSVICNQYIQGLKAYTLTIKLKPTTVTASPSTITETETDTVTSTSTVAPPDVSTTLTFSTSTITTITTLTTSQTVTTTTEIETLIASTSTTYAACTAAANLLGPKIQNGNTIDHVDNAVFGIGYVSSATECCNQCWNSGGCAASLWDSLQGYCFGVSPNGGTCTVGTQSDIGGFLETDLESPPYAGIVSNGPCGTWSDHGYVSI
ncbi:hypothetical protein ABW21_db0206530 [Orbilia brochopaga]|nr:hypothetical protein ABW21_db0206530 [Drechslerella brochopaga]